ncbi:SDR family oxidoreductase [Kalamiella sp. sgz302252]|uniref:SDR family oxidoreductase n=1 Tax=Pantoea sp. sgz302252 TaxID=3341827 RepID=UPI0036D32E33
MIAVTGATGQLGRLVIDALLKKASGEEIVAVVRSPEKAADLAALGVQIRQGDYTQPQTLIEAFRGVEKVLLISSSEIGQREAQHKAVIDAAKAADVKLLAYTSLLHADSTPMGLGGEHRTTEQALIASGIPYVILRNGWYSENYAASIAPALAHGVFIGAAKEGKIASASRQDYAEAAAVALTDKESVNKIYELAGDSAYTLAQFAAEIAKASGKEVSYLDLPQADFAAALTKAGLPEAIAEMLADSDANAAKGALYDDSHTLSKLIGRATTPWQDVVKAFVASA